MNFQLICIYVNQNMSFIFGTVSTLSLVSDQFLTFSFRESKKSTDKLNILLKNLHIDVIPEVIPEVIDTNV